MEDATVYDREFYTSLEGWVELGRLYGMFLALMGTAFTFLTLMAASGGAEVTRGMILFYGMLSVFGSAGAMLFILLMNHPNKWVGRATYVVLFGIPLLIELTN